MRNLILIISLFVAFGLSAQDDSTNVYKKRVLESLEIDFINSYYSQDGNNAAVTGGIGTEELTDVTPTIVINLPLNADDVLTIDAGISSYTSASSSNVNPFDNSGAYNIDNNDDDGDGNPNNASGIVGSPWGASSGASQQDTWVSVVASYAHSSDDRNNVWNANLSFAKEYDYESLGFGGGYTRLMNSKNTEISVSGNFYIDSWLPRYPMELGSYEQVDGNLNGGFFSGIDILNQSGAPIDKTGLNGPVWAPIEGFGLIQDKGRNTSSVSLSFSQILSKRAQMSIFMDIVQQSGWLANPMQRVYFKDVDNYYIGNAGSINNYASSENANVFQLADDIERLPDTRLKVPIGMRLNYFLNEIFAVRTYYRFYSDDWGITSNTASIEFPVKVSQKFTLYPSYRYYDQTAADYFAGYEEHVSTDEFYTSDYDLSAFNANQYGFGVSYTDVLTKFKIGSIGLKSIDLKYNNYSRNTGLTADYYGLGLKFVMD